ncbi:MAG: hypothetical protein ACOY93_14510 [Bacillota bacterium]
MESLVSVIDHVLASLEKGQLQVSNRDEVRAVLVRLRSLAIQGEHELGPSAAHREFAAEE